MEKDHILFAEVALPGQVQEPGHGLPRVDGIEEETLALRHGFSVVALVFPLLDQAGEGYPFASAHAVIAHEVRRCGFGLVDLTGDYLKAGMKALRARRRDNVHPNGRGHRLAALALAPEISSLLGPRSR